MPTTSTAAIVKDQTRIGLDEEAAHPGRVTCIGTDAETDVPACAVRE
jgi:putative transposon-encoded protein